jgi:hypothetical protein
MQREDVEMMRIFHLPESSSPDRAKRSKLPRGSHSPRHGRAADLGEAYSARQDGLRIYPRKEALSQKPRSSDLDKEAELARFIEML